ncbi:hypothetical protein QD460_20275 [Rhizobium jaguaris]|uniref:hypothetical protein n=1 Tax=Rhizobium jaguaris TaxID=1312183 RepID=UPI001FE0774B|nr:hypothetical protein [Rhizobium jaguaris]
MSFSIWLFGAFACEAASSAKTADAGEKAMATVAIKIVEKKRMKRNDQNSFIRLAFLPQKPDATLSSHGRRNDD